MALLQAAPRTEDEVRAGGPLETPPDQLVNITEEEWYARVYRGDALRALLTGSALGFVLALTNVYIGLKVGLHLGVSITAGILSYAAWNTAVRVGLASLEMVKSDGTIHLIGLYHGQPLALDSGKIQRKLLIGGYHVSGPLGAYADRAAELLASGQMRVDPLITHRFPAEQAPAAFGLLDQHLDQALGVLLEWAQE